MTSMFLFESVLIFVLVFVAVLVLAWIYTLFEWFASVLARKKPLFNTSEPNRRNQSMAPIA